MPVQFATLAMGNAFAAPPQNGSFSQVSTGVLADGTLVQARFNGNDPYTLQFFTSDGQPVASPVGHSIPPGSVFDAKVVPFADGGFAVVFADETQVPGVTPIDYGPAWYADFYDSSGARTAAGVQLIAPTQSGNPNVTHYHDALLSTLDATATADGHLFLAESYVNANPAPAGVPAGDHYHDPFSIQLGGVNGLFFDRTGAPAGTVVVNDVEKTDVDGTHFSGLDGTSEVHGSGIAALADGSVAIAYEAQQYYYAPDEVPGYGTYYMLEKTGGVSVDIINAAGENHWIDVSHGGFNDQPSDISISTGGAPMTVALGGDTFAVLWSEEHAGEAQLMMSTYDGSGDQIAGPVDLGAGIDWRPQFSKVAPLVGGNLVLATFQSESTDLLIEVISATGTILSRETVANPDLGLFDLRSAPDGSFYITHPSSDTSSTGYLTQHFVVGAAGDIAVDGTAGPDSFTAGAESHFFDGEGGIDTLDYSAATAPVTIDLAADPLYGVGTSSIGGSSYTDHFLNIEHFKGGSGNDVFHASAGGVTFEGGAGFDTLIGGAGNDDLDGGTNPGDQGDIMLGGPGDDTYHVDSTWDLVDEGFVFPDAGWGGTDTVISTANWYWDVESVGEIDRISEDASDPDHAGVTFVGGVFDNTLIGHSGTDILFGRGGNDTYIPGDGIDWISLSTLGLTDQNAYAGVDGHNTIIATPRTSGPSSYDIMFEFDPARDKVDVSAYHQYATGADVLSHAVDDGAGNSFVALGDGLDYLYFVGLTKAELNAADFVA